MSDQRNPILKRALDATRSFYESQVATGTSSEDTEGWRDTCDDLFHQLNKKEQKQVERLEKRLRDAYELELVT